MQVSFLLDENIAAPLADKLDKAGHDVQRVADVSELGEGVDDTTIRLYAGPRGPSHRHQRRRLRPDAGRITQWRVLRPRPVASPARTLPHHRARHRSVSQPGSDGYSEVYYYRLAVIHEQNE